MLLRNLNKIKLVTFDCTNTLLYFKRPVNLQYLKVAVELGHKKEDFDETAIMPSFKKNFKELREKYPNFGRTSIGYQSWWSSLVQTVLSDATNGNKGPQDFEKVADRLIKLYETKECWEKYEGCDEILRTLKHHGKLVGVISNFDPRLHVLLRDMKLYKHFDFIITSYEANLQKPDIKIFAHALEKSLGLTWDMIYPSEALHIGNELLNDHQGAIESGWSSILINDKEHGNHKLENTFKSLNHFYQALCNENISL